MQTYAQYAPTTFDCRGRALPDRQDWLVLPVIQTRDSGPTEQSNFAAALAILGGESDTVEVHRFGHWGPGWFEIILIHPSRSADGEAIEARLENYPLLDEDDASQREWDDYVETWTSCSVWRDFLRHLRVAFDLRGVTVEALADCDPDSLRSLYELGLPSGDYYEICDNGANFGRRPEYSARHLTRNQLAAFLHQSRNPVPTQ